MELTVICLSGVFLLLLVCYLLHLLRLLRWTKLKKRKASDFRTCVRQRKRLKRSNTVLGTLLVLSAIAVLSSSYYLLFTEGFEGATVDFDTPAKGTSRSASREPSPKITNQSTEGEETKASSSNEKVATQTTSRSEEVAQAAAETEKKADEEQRAKQLAETQKLEAEQQQAEAEKQAEAEAEEEGDGLPLTLEGSFETDAQGGAVIKGKAKKGIKQLMVTNSVNDQEQRIELGGDGTFSFNYEMTNPLETVILFICDASQVGNIAQEDRQQTAINANPDFMMAYQEQQNAQNEQAYE